MGEQVLHLEGKESKLGGINKMQFPIDLSILSYFEFSSSAFGVPLRKFNSTGLYWASTVARIFLVYN